jgi:hypothetical protein
MENQPKTNKEKFIEAFYAGLMPAGIVLFVLLMLWIPFKLVPMGIGGGSKYVATTLSSLLVSEEQAPSITLDNTTDKPKTNESSTNVNINTGITQIIKAPKVYSGKPDLEVTLISTGIIDPASKQFLQTNYAGFNDEIAMRFVVKNIGTNISGAWKLRINTPSRTTPYYDSESQVSIKPGDKIVYTTSFDSPVNVGVNTAYITADPLNAVDEISESNNLLIIPLKIEGTAYTYSNGYNYGSNSPTPSLPYGTLYTWSNLNVNCYANPQTSYINSPVTWYATVSGGSGNYTYSWVGTDQLYSNESVVSKTYYSSGTKMASVTITSNGSSITKQCSAFIY